MKRPRTTEKLLLSAPYPSGNVPRSRVGRRTRRALKEGRERLRRDGTERPETAGQNKPGTEEFILSSQERILSVPGEFLVPQEKCSFLEERELTNSTHKTRKARIINLIIINLITINLIIINLITRKIINLIIKLATKDKAQVTST